MCPQQELMLKKSLLVLVPFLALSCSTELFARKQNPNKKSDILEMSIEQLMEVTIESSATLTKAKPRLVLATVTILTKEDSWLSGTRSLNELLEIYVSYLQLKRIKTDECPGGEDYQLTIGFINYHHELNSTVSLKGTFSYDVFDHDTGYLENDPLSWRGDEYNTKLLRLAKRMID